MTKHKYLIDIDGRVRHYDTGELAPSVCDDVSCMPHADIEGRLWLKGECIAQLSDGGAHVWPEDESPHEHVVVVENDSETPHLLWCRDEDRAGSLAATMRDDYPDGHVSHWRLTPTTGAISLVTSTDNLPAESARQAILDVMQATLLRRVVHDGVDLVVKHTSVEAGVPGIIVVARERPGVSAMAQWNGPGPEDWVHMIPGSDGGSVEFDSVEGCIEHLLDLVRLGVVAARDRDAELREEQREIAARFAARNIALMSVGEQHPAAFENLPYDISGRE